MYLGARSGVKFRFVAKSFRCHQRQNPTDNNNNNNYNNKNDNNDTNNKNKQHQYLALCVFLQLSPLQLAAAILINIELCLPLRPELCFKIPMKYFQEYFAWMDE
ncbi:jmjC domain-containing protein C-like [Drosophila grimshawi]|uniref:jmjC domain-containing protein C-like n=1 Tax=Drosophila grimshawi TaxID=7222 RepID=UPI0013EF2EF9|nr:jmjC domain-containing protein C-like [Drosophila grimshawi]